MARGRQLPGNRRPLAMRASGGDLKVGIRLRDARKAAGLTQRELATRMGYPGAWTRLCVIERGKVYASLDWLWLAARVIGCDPHSLDPRLASDSPERP
jgi:transcriptional regulator with XRE-family HTH domain